MRTTASRTRPWPCRYMRSRCDLRHPEAPDRLSIPIGGQAPKWNISPPPSVTGVGRHFFIIFDLNPTAGAARRIFLKEVGLSRSVFRSGLVYLSNAADELVPGLYPSRPNRGAEHSFKCGIRSGRRLPLSLRIGPFPNQMFVGHMAFISSPPPTTEKSVHLSDQPWQSQSVPSGPYSRLMVAAVIVIAVLIVTGAFFVLVLPKTTDTVDQNRVTRPGRSTASFPERTSRWAVR